MQLPKEYMPKVPLTFRKDGGFRILMMSDLHHAPNTGDRTIRAMAQLIDRTCPDLVLLGGDNTTGKSTKEEFAQLLSDIASPMEARGIPWAHVFGNHDISEGLSKEYQQTQYEQYAHCVSKAGPDGVPGVGNFFLPIVDDSGAPVFGVWGLDSQQELNTQTEPLNYLGDLYWDLLMPGRIASYADYDFIRFEQIMWYWNTSVALEKLCGRKIPSLMAFHIPLFEFYALLKNAGRTQLRGEYNERLSISEVNSGLFAAVLQRGDVRAMFAGHDHINTFDGIYCGIRMGFDGSIGYHAYGTRDNDPASKNRDRLRGGRVFDITRDDPWHIHTDMVFVDEQHSEK